MKKRYYKEENGIKTWLGSVLVIDDMQIFNPSEEQILSAGYVEYVEPEPTEEELVEMARGALLSRIRRHDESQSVNVCYIKWQDQTIPYWANKQDRSDLVYAIQKYKEAGNSLYRLDLREVGVSVDIPCDNLLQMMAALEVYAVQCFNKTTDHIFAAKQLLTKEEMDLYDYTVGYPKVLTFEL